MALSFKSHSNIYTLESVVEMPIPVSKAWVFFSSPGNLAKITPPEMDFLITSGKPKPVYTGFGFPDVIKKSISGGVILAKFPGELKNTQAFETGIGISTTDSKVYIFEWLLKDNAIVAIYYLFAYS